MVNNCSNEVNIIEKESRKRKFCHSWLENKRIKNVLCSRTITELLELIHLNACDCSAEKLYTTLRAEIWKKQIPFSNILVLSYDNTCVMTNTNVCPCHASALVANAACSAIPEACEKLLRKVTSFISSSPKRACIFDQFQKLFSFDGICRKIFNCLKHDNFHACVARLNKNWDMLLKFLQKEREIKVWGSFTISDAKFRHTRISVPLDS
ncbi:hypothetical protein ALC56_06406 [Trachymyrmex septentrionalis]|uniref:Uncharacterized protein n=1 Tax=Trachymyrmex septentrionalis TaxID=34720 RepID=A0A151JX07_9HYME|nr:hypothetical protein ALC56_06406 [Trachymyrmex septentrionalis]